MAKTFDERTDVADVYAAALFALADEAKTADTVRGELEELVRLVESDAAFAAFLSSSAVDHDDRRTSLERLLRGKLTDVVLDTLQVMNAHGRVHLLAPLLRCFVLRQEHAAGQVEITVTSAVALSETQQAEIVRLAAELSGRKPVPEYVVEPQILGGLVLQIGDHRFDNSLRRQLEQTRLQLHERAERGVRVGVSEAAD